ncbi:MAG: ComEC/Rec2 family competence protein [Candidatus Gracilibacteria bacterium]|nr:ComEC/Rec2 family competence protein [Candidatus Gracilibacteria bacterium]
MLILFLYSRKFGVFFIISFIGMLLGLAYSSYNLDKIEHSQNYINQYIGKNLEIEASIESLYKKTPDYTSYIAKIEKIKSRDFKGKQIKVLLKIPGNYPLADKSIIKTKTKLEKIENFSQNFNYEKFLNSKGVFATSYLYSYETIGAYPKNKIETSLDFIKEKFLNSIKSIFPPDEANLLSGILIGERTETSKEIQSDFNNSGLTHIVAVSGFNITIIIVFLSYILKIFPMFFRSTLISIGVIGFVAIVGDNIAAIRAAIMGLLAYYILVSGRSGNSFVILLISAFIIVLYNPLILNYDISFQLSFLAVLGLIYTKNFFDKIFSFIPKILAIRESFVLTLSAFSFTLPIMIVYFGQVSILSPLANIAVGWTLPFTMLFGFISVILDFFSHQASYIIGFIARGFLAYILEVTHFFGNFYYSTLKIDFAEYSFYFLSFYYIILIFLILWFLPIKKEA